MVDESLVLVTHGEFDKGKETFEAAVDEGLRCVACPAPEAELASAVQARDAKAVIVGVEPYEAALYEALPKGSVIARFGVGHDGVDKGKATERGILTTNTPGVLNSAVAEHTMWLMGCVARRVADLDKRVKAGRWESTPGFELAGKTLAVVGLGGIGAQVVKIAALGFGMKVIAFGRTPKEEIPAKLGLGDWGEVMYAVGLTDYTCDVREALAPADVVAATLAFTPETANFFDEAKFAMLKPGAVFVNTARGGVVDESALFTALKEGRLAGAGLDVFAAEPYKPIEDEQDLRKLPNVVLTPHVGSNTVEANTRMAQAALQNVADGLAGNYGALSLLNPEVLTKLEA